LFREKRDLGRAYVMKESHLLRRGRFSAVGQTYHVTFATLKRNPLFIEFEFARAVIREVKRLDEQGLSDTLAFMLMPDHAHWLFTLSNGELSDVVSRAKSASARRVNEIRSRSETVWQKDFYDHGVRSDESLIKIARYIVANPLRAGLVDEIGSYPHWHASFL
jgi:putative transposase